MSLEWILILALLALVLYAFVAYQKLREEITGLRALVILQPAPPKPKRTKRSQEF